MHQGLNAWIIMPQIFIIKHATSINFWSFIMIYSVFMLILLNICDWLKLDLSHMILFDWTPFFCQLLVLLYLYMVHTFAFLLITEWIYFDIVVRFCELHHLLAQLGHVQILDCIDYLVQKAHRLIKAFELPQPTATVTMAC